tara:strand:- start:3404 stop:4444 length:1041 start_codon:yes stop_codon:yes gene_type:complete
MKIPADILKLFDNSSLNFKLRSESSDLWHESFSSLEYRPVDYLAANIDYQIEYQKQNYDEIIDLSSVIYCNQLPVAIWPVSLSIKGKECYFSSFGENILQPLFLIGISSKQIKKTNAEIFEICNRINSLLSNKYWQSSCTYINKDHLSPWHLHCMKNNAECSVVHNLYVDIRKDLNEIKSGIRRRYKPLINKGEKLWDIKVHNKTLGLEEWNEFKNLHLEVAGRKTRTDKSWEAQFNNINQNKAFLVTLRDEKRLIGGALFTFTEDEGRYDSAVYDRNLFDKPIGHAAQYVAIKEFKKMNISLYKIGRRFYNSDKPKPSAKEMSIADFKEGFASFTQPEYILKNFV